MNGFQLSDDLNVITAEIKMLENNMTKSLVEHGWEIGKRLSHAKTRIEHGGFGGWLENNFEFSHQYANQFMKFYRENPNYNSSSNFNKLPSWKHVVEVMYLPEKIDKEKFIEEKVIKEDGTTGSAKEIADYKKQIKEKDERIANLSETVKEMANQKPKVIEKVVTKEVIPPKYENLESDNQQLIQTLKEAHEKEKKAIEAAKKANDHYNKLLESRAETEENSEKYKQLTEAIRTAQSNLNDKQKLISNYQSLSSLLRTSNEFLSKASALVYQDLSEVISSDGLAKQELEFLVERTERFLTDLRKQINKKDIIEGEIING